MISVFGWPDPNTGFDQSEHALYTCYFIKKVDMDEKVLENGFLKCDICTDEYRAMLDKVDQWTKSAI